MSSSPTLPNNSMSRGGIVSIGFSIGIGIASILCTKAAVQNPNDQDNYTSDDQDGYSSVEIAFYTTWLLTLILAIAASPLTYIGGMIYMQPRTVSDISFRCAIIASWIMYGILILLSLITSALPFLYGDMEDYPWQLHVFVLLWAVTGWALMFLWAEHCRKSQNSSNVETNSTSGVIAPSPAPESNNVGPFSSEAGPVEVRIDPDGTQTVIERTCNPNGSITVVETRRRTEDRVDVESAIPPPSAPPKEMYENEEC